MKKLLKFIYINISFLSLLAISSAFSQAQPIAEWYIFPKSTWGKNNNSTIDTNLKQLQSDLSIFEAIPTLPLIDSKIPTERIINFFDFNSFPKSEFTIEMWILNHVNHNVGVSFGIYEKGTQDPTILQMSYFSKNLLIAAKNENKLEIKKNTIKNNNGWNEIFHHFILTYKNSTVKYYLNGELLGEINADITNNTKSQYLELDGFFDDEPLMEISSLLKSLRIYDKELRADEIVKSYENYKSITEQGIKYPSKLHFIAGPILTGITKNSIKVITETSSETIVTINYGKTNSLNQNLSSNQKSTIHHIAIENLEQDSKYFYEVIAKDSTGQEISSGILIFSTGSDDTNKAIKVAIIGDTESRPHINNKICEYVLDEHPDFAIQMGDLTDGGKKDRKFEWNYEFFPGMNQLISRVPFMPVAGNGEGDLYWFNKYFGFEDTAKGYYSFTFGNAEFFMLNSVPKAEFAPGGRQYVWLENQLQNSKAKWKFVVMHYAPYSSDNDDYGNAWEGDSKLGDVEVRKITSLFDKYNVDIVFFGHLHSYERSWKITDDQVKENKGTIYIQTGGAGGNLEDFAPTHSWFSAKTIRGFHYCMMDINGNSLYFQMYDINRNIKDFFKLEKGK